MAGPHSSVEQLPTGQSASKSAGNTSDEQSSQDEKPKKKESLLTRIWIKSGLNIGMLITMFKGALPPTIAIALFQNTGFANTYSTLGYLVAIMSILSFAIMPRAKFVQTMFFNIIGICIGSCIALLSIYCSVQARAHTAPHTESTSAGPSPGASVAPYNSSASAVCAIWLFFNIYISNTLRASRPQLQFPVIMYSIFANVASTYAPQFATMAQGISFAKRLLEAFLTGFGIAIAVSFLVFPLTSRTVVFKTAAGYIGALRGALKAQCAYLESLESKDAYRRRAKEETEDSGGHQATGLKSAVAVLAELDGKINGDVPFAKRELAYGKLNASEMSELIKLMRLVMLPVMGMSSVADIFDRVAERRGWKKASDLDSDEHQRTDEAKEAEIGQWNEIMRTLHEPFKVLTEAMDQGLEHALYTLELVDRPKTSPSRKVDKGKDGTATDTEAKGDIVDPGDQKFAAYISAKVDRFYEQRKLTLNTWCHQHGLDLKENQASHDRKLPGDPGWAEHERQQRRLYLILYMEFLLWSTGRAILNLVKFADEKVESGVMKKNRVIAPGMKRLKKWLTNALSHEDSSVDHTPDSTETPGINIQVGDAYQRSKDPEHLPPTNAWQRFGNGIRLVSGFLGSQPSAFGFRVACATLSVGIVAFLKDTQAFFIQQRLVWAMIMVAIGMTVTAGAGIFGFIGRVTGTTIAMCTSYLIWYIVDGKTPGVIVLMFLFTFCEFYFILRYPRFVVIAILAIVTQVLVVGYELQVQKVGLKIAESNGQPAYPLYELAPYRLACVAGGMFVAFIWTFFPYPLTARSQLRKDLGASLYLLANYYSCVHTTVRTRLHGTEGDPDDKHSLGRRLDKAREKVFTKEMALLAGLREHSNFTKWEPTFGGKFPRQQYDTIIDEAQNVLRYMGLISYASNILRKNNESDSVNASWLEDFSRLMHSINVTSHELTSTLSLLSASVTNGNALPPYLEAPKPYGLSVKLEAIDADILDVSHITEPGYAAFAVMQIASSLISDDMNKLIS
ncbi:MAG: hypothetical protein LQ350_002113 [Teloschistes chrysophthalmus]|nr:MAG: hypothetical protein LQ350_002113 [Niorma chrysophthalma]